MKRPSRDIASFSSWPPWSAGCESKFYAIPPPPNGYVWAGAHYALLRKALGRHYRQSRRLCRRNRYDFPVVCNWHDAFAVGPWPPGGCTTVCILCRPPVVPGHLEVALQCAFSVDLRWSLQRLEWLPYGRYLHLSTCFRHPSPPNGYVWAGAHYALLRKALGRHYRQSWRLCRRNRYDLPVVCNWHDAFAVGPCSLGGCTTVCILCGTAVDLVTWLEVVLWQVDTFPRPPRVWLSSCDHSTAGRAPRLVWLEDPMHGGFEGGMVRTIC